MLSGFLERWKTEWIDPALDYMDTGGRLKTDSHLNDVSIEYPEDDVRAATRNFDPGTLLGSGTFGSVYRGVMGDGTEVAIKVLQIPEEAGFEDEVKVLSRFRHPNLVILMGFTRHNDTGGRSLIYEYLAGGDVSKRLQRSRQHSEPFEAQQRLSAAVDAACGLSHLHNMNPRAFHRDIKGPNILLDKNGTAKMADFGLSCVSSHSHHKVQQASGTVGYACPEYIRSGIITEGSEVHSFGMVLLELLTGAPPAVQRPDKPNEFCYLVDHLQGSSTKVIQMLDATGHFPMPLATSLTDMAFRCITHHSADRPLFKQLVEELRHLLQSQLSEQANGGHQQQQGATQQQPGATRPSQGLQQQQAQQPQQQQQQQSQQPGVRRVTLAVGTAVEGRWRGGTGWFRGRIARVNQNGTFAIKYNDGDFEDQIPAQYIRPADVPSPVAQSGQQRGVSPGPQALGGPNLPPPPPPPAVAAQPPPARNRVQSESGSPQPTPLQPPGRPRGHSDGHNAGIAQQAPPLLPAARQSGSSAATSAAQSRPGGGASASAPARRRSPEPSPLCMPGAAPPMTAARFWCVFAEGVELNKLKDQQRAIPMPFSGQELVVGRTAQPAAIWDTLVPDRRLHGTVSREHFRVTAKRIPPSAGGVSEQTEFHLVCLSLNGVLLNSEYIGQNAGERRLQHGDVIAFAASVEPPVQHSNGTRPAPRKPFIVFSFEVLSPSGPSVDATPIPGPLSPCTRLRPAVEDKASNLDETRPVARVAVAPQPLREVPVDTGAPPFADRPRQLPEIESFEDGLTIPLVDVGTHGDRHRSQRGKPLPNALMASKAGALKPPAILERGDSESTSPRKGQERLIGTKPPTAGRGVGTGGHGTSRVAAEVSQTIQTTILTRPDSEGPSGDVDDLFSRTGFRQGIPEESECM